MVAEVFKKEFKNFDNPFHYVCNIINEDICGGFTVDRRLCHSRQEAIDWAKTYNVKRISIWTYKEYLQYLAKSRKRGRTV